MFHFKLQYNRKKKQYRIMQRLDTSPIWELYNGKCFFHEFEDAVKKIQRLESSQETEKTKKDKSNWLDVELQHA